MPQNSFLDNHHDSDVAVIGNGIAPLIAANHLISEGKSVLVLNPDFDFFLEDSELPLDPMIPLGSQPLDPDVLLAQDAESVVGALRPHFPGAVESWTAGLPESGGYHDILAPHVRQRNRLWIQSALGETDEGWKILEDAYLTASEAGLSPKILEGLQAAKRFPGFSSSTENFRGLLVPKFCDVDVTRYRNGILEFVRERLDPQRFVLSATQIEPMPGGLRFYSGGKPYTARIRDQVLVFWTPRLSAWVLNQCKRAETDPRLPLGVRLWEQWSLVSREALDPDVIGTYANLVVWAEIEGSPSAVPRLERLSVLRGGPLVEFGAALSSSWASAESFNALSSLCYDFLCWNHFRIRSMKPRAIFEWGNSEPWSLKSADPLVKIVPGCDGPLVRVVRRAMGAVL